MIRKVLVASAVGVLVGGFTGLVLLVGDVIGKLYLSGHDAEPRWYDTVAAAIVFGGSLVAASIAFRTALREQKRRRTA